MSGRRGAAGPALAAAAAAYAVAAWLVTPGFFDGAVPAEPYRWVSPPPALARNNQPPLAGHGAVVVGRGGQTDPTSVFTSENQPQASVSLLPGAFPAAATVDIRPATTFPPETGLLCQTNVYLVTASQPLQREALVTLRFSDAVPAPSDVYRAPKEGGSWTRVGSTGASSPFYISARSDQLGYFAGCYPGGADRAASGPRVGGGQTLPIIVGLAVVLVLIGGVPLALLRRRRPGDGGGAGGGEGDGVGGQDAGHDEARPDDRPGEGRGGGAEGPGHGAGGR